MMHLWYRSRLFWFGLVGATFLLWGWLGFARKSVDLCWGTRTATYCLGWGGWGEIGFVINKHIYIGLDGSPELGFYSIIEHLEVDDEPQLFAPALYLDDDRFGIFVANWLIVSIYTVLWLGGLAFWLRRKGRLCAVPI